MNNEPAFPTVDANRPEDCGTTGMTLRDYFAAKAMQGILSNLNGFAEAERISKRAYEIADAMMKARETE